MLSPILLGFSFWLAPLLLGLASAFHGTVVPPPRISRSSSLKAESGEPPISEVNRMDPALIEAVRQPLSWDTVTNSAVPDGDDDRDDDPSCWQNGQRWFQTRQALIDLWVLPRDISNGSWDNYAQAATRSEEKVLQQVPQLLRLEPNAVVASAKTVLNDLHLPPALLRKEPLLLAMDSERLRGGFEDIRTSIMANNTATASPLEACRDTEGLLVEAATKWTRSDDDGLELEDVIKSDNPEDIPDFLGDKTDTIQLLQKSFDNEVSADDLHMESFLQNDAES